MTFGASLKAWRRRRGLSQLRLGLEADVSQRHIAFLETGRANPTRGMVIRLSEALGVPRIERNRLLEAAGFAAAYASRGLDDGEMLAIRQAVDWMLERHDPFPALALDRHWSLVAVNGAAARLLGALGLGVGDSLLAAMQSVAAMRAAFANWPEVAAHMAARLRTESRFAGGDAVLDAAADTLAVEAAAAGLPAGVLPAVAAARLRAGDRVLSFFSTIAQFGTAEDIALADTRIELMFPADEPTRRYLLGGASCGGPV